MKISFVKLDLDAPGKAPVDAGAVLNEDIAFERAERVS